MRDSKHFLLSIYTWVLMCIKRAVTLFRKYSFFSKLFLLGFFICFVSEGIGIYPKEGVFVLSILFTLSLVFIAWKEKYLISQKFMWMFFVSFVYLIYLLFLTNYSLNKQVSFEYLVYFLSLFLLFLTVINNWRQIESVFLYSLLGLGVFFSLYAFILPYLLSYNSLFLLYPQTGYQYVYSLFGSNNHLGEFLVFPMLISLYLYFQKKKTFFIFLFGFYFLFFIFSYSRAGYISFLIGFLVLCIQQRENITAIQKKIGIGLSIIICLFFILTSTSILQNSNLRFLSKYVVIYGKSSFETRGEYILQTVEGFLQYRYFGVGLGNFSYISKMFAFSPSLWTASSHNVFLDILVETGTVGFIGFIYFFVVLLRKIKEQSKSIYAALLLSWLITIQFDYLHQMYSYLLLFPIFLGGLLSEKELSYKKMIYIRIIPFLMCVLLVIFLIQYVLSLYFLGTGNSSLSRKIYPLQRQAYEYEYYQTNLEEKNIIVRDYTRFFSGEYWGFYELGKISEQEGDMVHAIENYEKSFWLSPFRDLNISERIYYLQLRYEGEKKAGRFIEKLFKKLDNETEEYVLSYDDWVFINKFCQNVHNLHCPYILQ